MSETVLEKRERLLREAARNIVRKADSSTKKRYKNPTWMRGYFTRELNTEFKKRIEEHGITEFNTYVVLLFLNLMSNDPNYEGTKYRNQYEADLIAIVRANKFKVEPLSVRSNIKGEKMNNGIYAPGTGIDKRIRLEKELKLLIQSYLVNWPLAMEPQDGADMTSFNLALIIILKAILSPSGQSLFSKMTAAIKDNLTGSGFILRQVDRTNFQHQLSNAEEFLKESIEADEINSSEQPAAS